MCWADEFVPVAGFRLDIAAMLSPDCMGIEVDSKWQSQKINEKTKQTRKIKREFIIAIENFRLNIDNKFCVCEQNPPTSSLPPPSAGFYAVGRASSTETNILPKLFFVFYNANPWYFFTGGDYGCGLFHYNLLSKYVGTLLQNAKK